MHGLDVRLRVRKLLIDRSTEVRKADPIDGMAHLRDDAFAQLLFDASDADFAPDTTALGECDRPVLARRGVSGPQGRPAPLCRADRGGCACRARHDGARADGFRRALGLPVASDATKGGGGRREKAERGKGEDSIKSGFVRNRGIAAALATALLTLTTRGKCNRRDEEEQAHAVALQVRSEDPN